MAHFILVHGMFHGGWSWDRVKQQLEDDGHSVVAPDLAGCGSDPTPPGDVTLAGWAGAIAELAQQAPSPAILVGHSRGGIVISAAAERAPQSIAALIYLTALMLPNGATAMTLPQIMQEEGFSSDQPLLAPRMNADNTALLAPENAEDIFYADLSEDDRAWAAPQIGHEPLGPMMTPLAISEGGWGSVPRFYIETTRDTTLPIEGQRALIARTGVREVFTLDTDHMPILTHVADTARMLERIAERL